MRSFFDQSCFRHHVLVVVVGNEEDVGGFGDLLVDGFQGGEFDNVDGGLGGDARELLFQVVVSFEEGVGGEEVSDQDAAIDVLGG